MWYDLRRNGGHGILIFEGEYFCLPIPEGQESMVIIHTNMYVNLNKVKHLVGPISEAVQGLEWWITMKN